MMNQLLTPPNLITLSRPVGVTLLCAALISGVVIPWWGTLLVLGVFCWVTDALDGYVARRTNSVTQFGEVLDILCDRVVDIMIACTAILINPIAAPWACAFILLRFAPEFIVGKVDGQYMAMTIQNKLLPKLFWVIRVGAITTMLHFDTDLVHAMGLILVLSTALYWVQVVAVLRKLTQPHGGSSSIPS